MRIVVNHVTRMAPGYICIAGVDLESREHVRPVLGAASLWRELLQPAGPFDMGAVVDLGEVTHRGSPPEVEDHLFMPSKAAWAGYLTPQEFWDLLIDLSERSLKGLFGDEIQYLGHGGAVDVGTGRASLGVLRPAFSPRIEITRYGRVRLRVHDAGTAFDLPVTDLRLYEADQETPRARQVRDLQLRISRGAGVLLSLGLGRAWQRPDDTEPRHWLQVNNIHLQDNPLWRVA